MGFFSKDIEIDDFYERGKYTLALRLCFLFSGLFALLTIFESFNSVRNSIVYAICTIIPIVELIYLKKTKKYRVVYLTLCSIGSILAFYTLNFFTEEIHYGDLLWMILIILLAYWGVSIKMGVVFLIINLLIIANYFAFNMQTNLTSLREFDFISTLSVYAEVTVAFISISTIIHQFVQFYKYSYETLLENKLILEKSNKLITTKNEENIVLMKEVHHRVKNNLQIITSLLRLQKQNLTPEVQEKFDESISRVMTMALIHRKLYQSTDLTNVNLESYINDLVNEIFASLAMDDNVKTTIQSDYNNIGLKTIVPLGLLLNELLSNSFKHAFNQINNNEISITISGTNNQSFELKYQDNGNWKNINDDDHHFGLELIDTLTEQMEGSYTREDSSYTFKLKNLDI
ncbi:MAG: sensor histidine kinase [Flavobacteriales bacterium]